ncbi:hypothetical protein BIW11_07803 [Tropilaelaps mercedesae]|uniref:Uncharacterized protein n=1 Tax=Tropilaelaps mercedesae TaxID=418985 RepID=A0A1V9XSC6_9ACAR|nr:hypothetical protein BIW11_07803 [Tropilaelaps mercedesae]
MVICNMLRFDRRCHYRTLSLRPRLPPPTEPQQLSLLLLLTSRPPTDHKRHPIRRLHFSLGLISRPVITTLLTSPVHINRPPPNIRPQSQSGYPQYESQAPQYAPNYAYPASVSGGYRQPQSTGLYASAQTNVPQRLQPAFPDFFRSALPVQTSQAQAYQQPNPQQYRSPVSAAPVSPVQSYAAPPQYRQPAPVYQQPASQYQLAPRQTTPALAAYGAAPTNDAGSKKKYEDGQYDPELTKAGLYYPDLYEKVSTGKDGQPQSPTASQIAQAAANAPQGPRPLPYFDPSLLAYNIGTQQQAHPQQSQAASQA